LNPLVQTACEIIQKRLGPLHRLAGSQSLFEIKELRLCIYFRYSKMMKNQNKTWAFYGLRQSDLKYMTGSNAFICLIWNDQNEPIFLPFSEFEPAFNMYPPSNDGQYKVNLFFKKTGVILNLAKVGNFNIEPYIGWSVLYNALDKSSVINIPDLNHIQIQTLLGRIGFINQYDIWIPKKDRSQIIWDIADKYEIKEQFPTGWSVVQHIIEEIDVLWIERGSNKIQALYEVEFSTPIYSGLLRFNDIFLTDNRFRPQFSIVSDENNKSLYLKQISRPTFKNSGLGELCSFLYYKDVYL